MEKNNLFKKIYYSIVGKKYDSMIKESVFRAIAYLAVLELLFVLVLSYIVARDIANGAIGKSPIGIYYFIYDYLLGYFLYDSIALTFDSMLILTLGYYIIRILIKKKVRYSHIFNLATYASTLPLLINFASYIIYYDVQAFDLRMLKLAYVYLFALYFFTQSKHLEVIEENKPNEKEMAAENNK